MRVIKNIEVPTGNIIIAEGQKGKLEFLSIGDYGKDVNIKANFLDLNREPQPVKHTNLLSLEEKWVITISTQYSCKMGCTFCDVPKIKKRGDINASLNDLKNQIKLGLLLHPEIKKTKRLNVHFARMGEPSFNGENVLACSRWLKSCIDPTHKVHPVVSTMLPRHNKNLKSFLWSWVTIKNNLYDGNAGLQLSINTTDEQIRKQIFRNNSLNLEEISNAMRGLKPEGRKFTLNFPVCDWPIDGKILLKYFDPDDYIIKLTPMHKTSAALKNNIKTDGDYTTYYPYQEIEKHLIGCGYDVLVFIASKEEDESKITCGNAILSEI
jgi:23S rRNA (adenine2503-C2)-methyltransferase